MKRVLALLGMLLFVLTGSAAAQNSAPSIAAAAPVYLTAGDPASSATVATVSDAEDGAGSLAVTATSMPSGVSVSNITNTAGTITATISVACDAAAGENDVVLEVADSGGATATATFVVNVALTPLPTTPTISATENGTGTTDQACPEQPLTLTATATGATSYQWYSNNDTIAGATSATYQATGTATYYVTAVNSCGTSAMSDGYVVQNPTPHKAFLITVGSTSFCSGGSVTIWSDSATGIQWYKDGVAIPGAGSQSYVATQSGSYTAILNSLGCHSQTSDAVVVTVNATPATPTISAAENGTGTTDQACPEQPLTLTATSSGATSFQWYADGGPISGATSSTLIVTGVGDYTVTASANGCSSATSAAYTVHNPTPHKPFLTTSGSTTFCSGGSVTIWSDSATGIQWYKDGVAIAGAGSQSYVATQSGSYTAILNALGCHSQTSDPVVVTVNATPLTPTISATENGTGTTDQACPEQPLTLTATSSGATSFQWYADGGPINGATNSTLTVTGVGDYTVTASTNGCSSATSAAYTVHNPTPHKPFLTASGSTTFCAGGSVTIWSDSATGIQWYKDGVAIAGATSQSYTATVSGSYTAVLNALGCHSATSDPVVVTVDSNPDATIAPPSLVVASSTGNSASVASAGSGATYTWSISGGTIASGNGTNAITFTAGAPGTLTLQVTVTTSAGCSETSSANVVVAEPVVVTSIHPPTGAAEGGTAITINGSGFATGATVTLGGTAATNVVVVSSTKITATTPAHAAGTVDVTVTNANTVGGTLTNGFTYRKPKK